MQRIVRTLDLDGHHAAVVEDVDEDGSTFLVSVDGTIVNADAPLPHIPSDGEVRTLMAAPNR